MEKANIFDEVIEKVLKDLKSAVDDRNYELAQQLTSVLYDVTNLKKEIFGS